MIDVVLAWSGGKDSTLALAALRADSRYRVVALLTTVTREYDRISIHGVRRAVLEAQVRALGLPLLEATIPSGSSNADYEAAFVDTGYRAILTCVDTTQLGSEFAGREFDAALLAELPEAVDPCGEQGEFHTCVYAGPHFAHPLPLIAGERVRRDARFEYCDVLLTPDATVAA